MAATKSRVYVEPYVREGIEHVSGYWRAGAAVDKFVQALTSRVTAVLTRAPGDDASLVDFWDRPKTKESFRTSSWESRLRRGYLERAIEKHYGGDQAAFSQAAARDILARRARATEVGYQGPTPTVDWQTLVFAARHEWSPGLERDVYDPDPDQYRNIAVEHLRALMADAKVSTRIEEHNLVRVLEEGRFRNQLERGVRPSSPDAVYAPEDRRRIEREVFGLEEAKGRDHPVYGYVASASEPEAAGLWVDSYGSMRVVFKDDVKKRTSVTYGDMMYGADHHQVVPAPFEAFDWLAFGRGIQGDKDSPFMAGVDGVRHQDAPRPDRHFYFDAQIHGGATVDDIDHIEVSKPLAADDEVGKMLADANIPVVVRDAEPRTRETARAVMERYGANLPPEPVLPHSFSASFSEPADSLRPLPEAFADVADAEDWFRSRELEADFKGFVSDDNREERLTALREFARAVDYVLEEFPHIMENPEWRFGGIATYQSEKTPARVRHWGKDATAATENRKEGPWVFVNEDSYFGDNGLFGSIGFTAGDGAYETMLHEMGHVVHTTGVASKRADGSLSYNQFDERDLGRAVIDAKHDVWGTPTLLKKKFPKDVSIYGMGEWEETFAEAFVRLNSPASMERVGSVAGRKRLQRFREHINETVGAYTNRPGVRVI